MRDEFAGSRLPDLPTAGYATKREKRLTDEIMFFLRGAERNRIFLLTMVCDGREKFRKVTKTAWRHLKVSDSLCDAVFGYLVLLAGPNPHDQRARLELLSGQQATTSWDKRLNTRLRLARDRKDLEMDIVRESLKPRKVYSH